MKNLTKTHQQRWDAAQALFHSLICSALSNDAVIMFDGDKTEIDQFKFGESFIHIVDGNVTYVLFEADPDQDAGLFTRKSDYEHEMRQRFSVVCEIPW